VCSGTQGCIRPTCQMPCQTSAQCQFASGCTACVNGRCVSNRLIGTGCISNEAGLRARLSSNAANNVQICAGARIVLSSEIVVPFQVNQLRLSCANGGECIISGNGNTRLLNFQVSNQKIYITGITFQKGTAQNGSLSLVQYD
jgi:hypothetical protein